MHDYNLVRFIQYPEFVSIQCPYQQSVFDLMHIPPEIIFFFDEISLLMKILEG